MTLAHQVVSRSDVWGSWSAEPAVLAGLALAALAHWRGSAALARRGRGPATGRVLAWYGGLAVLAAALVSPLDALSSTLFSAHMVQHLLLVFVAAPLLAWARPGLVLLHALPAAVRRLRRLRPLRRAAAVVAHPLVVWGVGTAALWAWHMPALYERALASDVVHAAEHASFLGSAVLLWAVVAAAGTRRGVAPPVVVALVFATALQSGALGAVLTFATSALYPVHAAGARAWGLGPVEDQQLAGVLMWVPAGLVYTATMATLLVRWFKELDANPPERLAVAVGHR